jgi:hypothetical protein
MKGVSVNALRATVQSILDKVDQLLTTEPARMIGYGAAVVLFLAVQLIGIVRPGLLPPVSFDAAVGDAFAAIATLVILVESIRRFVFSPQTYIEDLADESDAAHEAAHMEDDLRRWAEAVKAQQDAPQKVAIPVGTVPQSDKQN